MVGRQAIDQGGQIKRPVGLATYLVDRLSQDLPPLTVSCVIFHSEHLPQSLGRAPAGLAPFILIEARIILGQQTKRQRTTGCLTGREKCDCRFPPQLRTIIALHCRPDGGVSIGGEIPLAIEQDRGHASKKALLDNPLYERGLPAA
jgi:hypothetical protein